LSVWRGRVGSFGLSASTTPARLLHDQDTNSMPYLLQFGVDKAFQQPKNVYYFKYSGVRFKFIQNNPRKWSDALLTIVDEYRSPLAQTAYTAAGQWASALAWNRDVPVALRVQGGHSWPKPYPLRRARCFVRDWPRLPFHGLMRGDYFSSIARFKTKDQLLGATLYREARSSNSLLLSILLYWQVLEIQTRDPVGWISKVVRRNPEVLRHTREFLHRLPLGHRSLGAYLNDDCRHAIAHIKRKPGKRALEFHSLQEDERLGRSEAVLEQLARHKVSNDLGPIETLLLVQQTTSWRFHLKEPSIVTEAA